jgi:magnesium transporter
MARPRKRYSTPGTPPGTLRPSETPRTEQVSVTVMDYTADSFLEKQVASIEEVFPFRDRPSVTWINVNGLQDVELLQKLGSWFGLHPLALEDVLNTGQRPKLEDYDSHYFIVMKDVRTGAGQQPEQISFFLGRGWVLTFQETTGDPFDPVRERIRKGRGRLRSMGADYLAYALMDALVDGAFPRLEKLGERIEEIELELVGSPAPETLHEIHRLKRELLYLRRSAWPQREVINALQREESSLVRPETRIYLRDCYDHTIQILDMVETYRDLTSGMVDIYLSSVSNRMNEIMKVLTIMASVFIPLTFLAGLYGMNFNPTSSPWNMPELNWHWGYPAVLGIMAAVAAAMLVYFHRKGWI